MQAIFKSNEPMRKPWRRSLTNRSAESASQSKRASDSHELRLVLEFREIVREPVPDPNDPRFKNWNVRERFPWGWQIVQQQLHERVARRGREYDQSLKG